MPRTILLGKAETTRSVRRQVTCRGQHAGSPCLMQVDMKNKTNRWASYAEARETGCCGMTHKLFMPPNNKRHFYMIKISTHLAQRRATCPVSPTEGKRKRKQELSPLCLVTLDAVRATTWCSGCIPSPHNKLYPSTWRLKGITLELLLSGILKHQQEKAANQVPISVCDAFWDATFLLTHSLYYPNDVGRYTHFHWVFPILIDFTPQVIKPVINLYQHWNLSLYLRYASGDLTGNHRLAPWTHMTLRESAFAQEDSWFHLSSVHLPSNLNDLPLTSHMHKIHIGRQPLVVPFHCALEKKYMPYIGCLKWYSLCIIVVNS